MTRLILCRHARTADGGRRRALAEALRPLPLAAVYTSPLTRALVTARAIAAAHGLEPKAIDDLREIDFGDVDGRSFDELPDDLQQGLLHAPTCVTFPGGESYAQLRRRVCRALGNVVAHHPEAIVVAVTHAGPIRAALASWLSVGDEAVFRIDQREAAVNVVDWNDGIPLVRLVNGRTPSG